MLGDSFCVPAPDYGWDGGLSSGWCWACAVSALPCCSRAQSMAAWADGCSLCWLLTLLLLLISFLSSLLLLSGDLTNQRSLLHSSLLSSLCIVSPLCCYNFTLFPAFCQLFPLSLALPFPCYFPCLLCDWLAIYMHQSLPGLHRHCHISAHPLSPSSYLQLWTLPHLC